MKRLKPKQDVYMEDRELYNDLKVKKEVEQEEMFELIMDSVCNEKGNLLSKEETERIDLKFKNDCKLFIEEMKNMKTRPL